MARLLVYPNQKNWCPLGTKFCKFFWHVVVVCRVSIVTLSQSDCPSFYGTPDSRRPSGNFFKRTSGTCQISLYHNWFFWRFNNSPPWSSPHQCCSIFGAWICPFLCGSGYFHTFPRVYRTSNNYNFLLSIYTHNYFRSFYSSGFSYIHD